MTSNIFVNYHDWLQQQPLPPGQKATLAAAMTLFAAQGFAGTTTSAIAQAAGISQATIFKYYHTKQDLLIAIVEPVLAHLLPVYRDDFFARMQTCATLDDLVRFIVTDRYQFIMANAEVVKIIVMEMMISGDMRHLLKQIFMTQHHDFLKLLSQNFQRTGDLRPDVTGIDILRTIAGQLVGYVMQRDYLPASVNPEQDLPRLIDQISQALRASK